MCRLFGILSADPVDARWPLLAAPYSLLAQSQIDAERKQGDGWGVGWFDGEKPRVFKRPRPMFQEEWQVREASERAEGTSPVGHVRWASNPLKLPKSKLIGLPHTQPFTHGKWLFAHNGTVYIPNEVKATLGPWARHIKGRNDSEVLFYLILKNLTSPSPKPAPSPKRLWRVGDSPSGGRGGSLKFPSPLTGEGQGEGGVPEAIRKSVQALHNLWKSYRRKYRIYRHPYHGLNLVLTDGSLFFSLCYVNPDGFGKSKALGGPGKPYYQMHLQRTPRQVTLASEPLTLENNWTPLQNGQGVVAHRTRRGVETHLIQVIR